MHNSLSFKEKFLSQSWQQYTQLGIQAIDHQIDDLSCRADSETSPELYSLATWCSLYIGSNYDESSISQVS